MVSRKTTHVRMPGAATGVTMPARSVRGYPYIESKNTSAGRILSHSYDHENQFDT